MTVKKKSTLVLSQLRCAGDPSRRLSWRGVVWVRLMATATSGGARLWGLHVSKPCTGCVATRGVGGQVTQRGLPSREGSPRPLKRKLCFPQSLSRWMGVGAQL